MVPTWEDGVFQQHIMEYVVTDPSNSQWNLRHKAAQPPTSGAPGPMLTAPGMPQKAKSHGSVLDKDCR